MDKKKQHHIKNLTFTKKCVGIILIVALADIQLSYLLAYLGRPEIAQTLSITIVTEIIGVMTGYFIKSYNETKQEKSLEWRKEKYFDAEEHENIFPTINSDDSVG